MTYEEMLKIEPYSLNRKEKEKILTERLVDLTTLHRRKCYEYARILDSVSYSEKLVSSYLDLPFLPVRLFKERELRSVENDEIIKTMTSSGTTGQKVSKIFLDRTTSSNQQKTMVKIVSDFTGSARMPMLIIDSVAVLKNRQMFSARGAGILGFSMFGSKKKYVLNEDMSLNIELLREFLKENEGQRILLFGFTFMIWEHFYKKLLKIKQETGEVFDFSNAILIHGGGWKKLINEAVSSVEFKEKLTDLCGLYDIHDYYGMVEQTGCIYMECECGNLHASIFSDVVIRNPKDFSVMKNGERGIIQVVSTIPESYPGHSLLTEDEGIVLGEDDCKCGRKGKYFKVLGRLKNAEIRGCSDTYASDFDKKNEAETQDDNVLKHVTFLIGNNEVVKSLPEQNVSKPFDDETIAFLDDFSKSILSNRIAKMYPDIITLAFWLRKANVLNLKERFLKESKEHSSIGRGVLFHIAPSNVPINFAYTLFAGIMMGNSNIVRVPSKAFPQIDIIISGLNDVLNKYDKIRNKNVLVRYDRQKNINDYFSEICDGRIIWGGDSTISEIRKSPIKARAIEVTFADRYSVAIIDSDEYLTNDGKKRIAGDFYNDTFLSDQNACTSPRIIIWCGNHIDEAKELFWGELHKIVEEKYVFQPVQSIDKLLNGYLVVTDSRNDLPKMILMEKNNDNLITRVTVDSLTPALMAYKGNSGFFYEYNCKDILELRALCNDVRCQTVGIVGDESIIRDLLDLGLKGVDRVVKVGHTMDFDLIWDGYNLYDSFTRKVAIK